MAAIRGSPVCDFFIKKIDEILEGECNEILYLYPR